MMLKYAFAFSVLLASGPVFAQAAANTPPAAGSSHSEPQSANSLPPGAANMNLNSAANPNLAGSALGSVTTTAPAPQPPTRP
jgi:hypothetical protein